MKNDKILDKVLSGINDRNIRFQDLRTLLIRYGFTERIRGDHHIFTKEHIFEIINLQPLKGGKTFIVTKISELDTFFIDISS